MARDSSRTTLPRLGPRGTLLFLWRQLTSMQTALVLLLLLAVAAVPGRRRRGRRVHTTEERGTPPGPPVGVRAAWS